MKKTLSQVNPWQPEQDRAHALRLDLNENIYAPTKKTIQALRAFSDLTINAYPHYDHFIEALADYTKMPEQSLLPTNGASQAMMVVIHALFEKGNKVVIPSPVFYPYYHFLKLEGAKIAPTYYHYNQSQEKWLFPLEETIQALNGAKGLILVNPNNPIGVAIPNAVIKTLLNEAAKRNIYVIIDEAYIEFGGTSARNYIRNHPNLMIIRTFSKFFGLTGLRLGYILAQASMIKELSKVKGPWDVNRFATFAGVSVLKQKEEFLGIKKLIEQSRQELYLFFKQHQIDTWQSDTNFLTIRLPHATSIFDRLVKQKIFVFNLSGYPYSQNLFEQALRVTVPINKDLALFQKKFKQSIDA